MRNYVNRTNMDRDIKNAVKAFKGCALAAMLDPIKLSPWPKTDRTWSRIHIDFAGPLDAFCYLFVVDSFSKWQETFRYKKATTEVLANFLYLLFARFGSVDSIISYNESQFMPSELKEFCQTFTVEHITHSPYHLRRNGQVKRFVDTFKRGLRKARDTPTDKVMQQFL